MTQAEARLATTANLRDLGGMRTIDGGTMRRGLVYRSAALAGLAPDALADLKALGLRSIVDLRRDREREAHPTPWQEIGCPSYWHSSTAEAAGDLRGWLGKRNRSGAAMRAAMLTLYEGLPDTHAGAFRHLFAELAAGHAPLLFHCTAGKDRTGAAAALVLFALGAPRETILDDYVATQQFDLMDSGPFRDLSRRSADETAAMAPMFAADPDYLDAMIAGIEKRYGTIDTYLDRVLGVDADLRVRLRQHLIK